MPLELVPKIWNGPVDPTVPPSIIIVGAVSYPDPPVSYVKDLTYFL